MQHTKGYAPSGFAPPLSHYQHRLRLSMPLIRCWAYCFPFQPPDVCYSGLRRHCLWPGGSVPADPPHGVQCQQPSLAAIEIRPPSQDEERRAERHAPRCRSDLRGRPGRIPHQLLRLLVLFGGKQPPGTEPSVPSILPQSRQVKACPLCGVFYTAGRRYIRWTGLIWWQWELRA